MKISGANASSATSTSRAASPAAAGGFSLSEAAESTGAAPTAPTAGLNAVGSLDALIALQAVGDPLERRRKAIRRAGQILDVLDEVKLAVLDGAVSQDALERLVGAVRQERGEADDEGLQALLDQIETRAAVELAKIEVARAAA